jgi:hypothetical protein
LSPNLTKPGKQTVFFFNIFHGCLLAQYATIKQSNYLHCIIWNFIHLVNHNERTHNGSNCNNTLAISIKKNRGHRGRMVFGFTTTYAIWPITTNVRIPLRQYIIVINRIKIVSGFHDITKVLLKVALNNINQTIIKKLFMFCLMNPHDFNMRKQ